MKLEHNQITFEHSAFGPQYGTVNNSDPMTIGNKLIYIWI